jgi:hypothetical protein
MILTPAVGPVIDTDHVAETCESYRTMTGARKTLVERELLRIGGQLHDLKTDLTAKLGAGFDYLETHAADDTREAIWFDWKAQYEAITDTQTLIALTVLSAREAA